MVLNPNDSQTAIRVLNSSLQKTQDEIDLAKETALITNRTVKSLDATVNGTIELDPYGQPIPVRDKSGETIYDDYGEPIFQRKGDGIVMTKVKVDELEANAITTEKLESGVAKIKDAYIESINGNKISNSHILAKALSDSAIETVLGSHVFYGTDDNPPVNPKEKDLWYKTVVEDESEPILFEYQNGTWVNVDFDFKTLRANSITTQEIASNSINADHIEGGTLTLGTLEQSVQDSIGNIDGKVDSTNGSGQMSWDDGALRIDASDGANYYETEISGDGINFRYGSSLEYARSNDGIVAKINQQYMEINKTIVFTEMQIGNWSWAINPLSGHLQVKWNGGK